MTTKGSQVEAARLVQLGAFAPAVFGPGTLLYVGASADRAHCLSALVAAGRDVTILEAWPANAEFYRARTTVRVVCGDVREAATLKLPSDTYDVAFWWHGPEHISREELPAVLAGLEQRATMVVLACPWGGSPQGARGGNDYEIHRSALAPEDFSALGYRVNAIGRPGGQTLSNIIAVKP